MKRSLHVMIALIILTGLSFGQAGVADIYGTVLLPDGSAIPGVAVTLTGDVIGSKTTVSSEEGNYRFISLPPGNYELKFELDGFKTVVQRGLRVTIGKSSNINVTLETSSIKEEVTISGKTGVVDVRRVSVGVNLSGAQLRALPTARNPWTVLSLIPGMMLDRVDVGGAESGQQSTFLGNGASRYDTQWNVDGATITDAAALGASPGYLNMNAYEEMQVNIGSNDISAQTGGTQINFVSKRGGNRYSGDFHLYAQDKAWEYNQTLPANQIAMGRVSPGVNRLKQYGINFGGPVVNDKLWFFGSYSIQDIVGRLMNGTDDTTLLVSGYGKINYQLGNLSGEFQYTKDDKLKWGRTAIGATQQDVGSFWDQWGPTTNYRTSLQFVTGNLMLSAKAIYTDGGFVLSPKAGTLDAPNNHLKGPDYTYYLAPIGYIGKNYLRQDIDRNSYNVGLDGNYFLENVLGADHEWKFGVDYYWAEAVTQSWYPNNRFNLVWDKVNTAAARKVTYFYAPGIVNVAMDRLSFYLQDTATFGKLTVNLGVRYDLEQGYHQAASTGKGAWYESTNSDTGAGSFTSDQAEWFNTWLPALSTVPGKVAGSERSVISPRLSLSYDLTGDGRNLLKLSVARYGSAGGTGPAGVTYAVGTRRVAQYWTDNGDMIPQANEYTFSNNPADWYGRTLNTLNPGQAVSNNSFDPDYSAPLLDELTVVYERALGTDMAISLSGFYKKRFNMEWARGILSVDANRKPVELDNAANYSTTNTIDVNGQQKTVYYRTRQPIGTYQTNFKNDYQQFLSVQAIMQKKLSNKWMADLSFVYSDWKNFYDKGDYAIGGSGLTNYDFFNESFEAPEANASGITGIFINTRWEVKSNFLYQLPGGLNLTGVFQMREGYVVPYYVNHTFPVGVGSVKVYEPGKKLGDDRLPMFWMLNMGLEKSFKLSETANVTLMVNAYNITNNTTTMSVNALLGNARTDEVLRILNPGNFQFGVRVNF